MTNISQPQTFNDLYISLLNKVREQTSQTATVNQAKSAVNTGLMDMHIGWGERFPWAERQARLTTMAPYSTGTVSIPKGSVNLVGIGTNWATLNSFGVQNVRPTGKLVISGSPTIYEISNAAIGATTLTLTSPFVENSVVNGTYLYFEDEYDLSPDFLRPLDMQYFDARSEIKIIDRNRFRRNFPKNSIPGKPSIACILDRAFVGNTVPVRRVALYRAPNANFSIPYSFVTNKLAVSATGVPQTSLIADTDEPIVPLQYRHAIVMHGLFNWYRDKKDDTRSAETRQEFVDLMMRIAGDTEIGERRPKIQPVMGKYRGRARAPYRRGAGRSGYTAGSRFDRMEDW
jgi:hypothetical protein